MGDQEFPLKASPSLLYQNLSFGESKFFYVHKGEVHCIHASSKETTSLHIKDKSTIHQVKIVKLGWGVVVILAAKCGAQVWDIRKEKALFTVTASDEGIFLSRGIAALENNVFLGLSSGAIAVFSTSKDGAKQSSSLKHHREMITDICAGQLELGNVLVSADVAGEVIIWGSDLNPKVHFIKIQGDVCTCIAVTPQNIVCGYGSGKIRMYSPTGSKMVEIAAHGKWINSIDYCPKSNLLASVGEDMLLQFWLMPSSSSPKVSHVGNRVVKDCLLTGTCFTDDGLSVGCCAYDTERLFLFEVPH
jgi:WD40 repeat protein